MNRTDFIKAVAASAGFAVTPWQLGMLEKLEAAEKATPITNESLFAEVNARFKIITELAPDSAGITSYGLAPLPEKGEFLQYPTVGTADAAYFRRMRFYDELDSLEELRDSLLAKIDTQPAEFKHRIFWRTRPVICAISNPLTGWRGYSLNARFIMCREITGVNERGLTFKL
jgi:hypothetical protein